MVTDAMASVWWIRRDARLADNPALLEAIEGEGAAPVFPWSALLVRWSPRRRAYLARSLWSLREDAGGAVSVRQGSPSQVLADAAAEVGATEVWAQREFSPSGIREQDSVAAALAERGVDLRLHGSPYAVAPGRVLKEDGTEYRVFTPFFKAWRAHGWRSPAATASADALLRLTSDVDLNQIAAHGDVHDPLGYPVPFMERAWRERLDDFIAGPLRDYADGRDFPAHDVTSHLSLPLAFGQIHPRTMLDASARAARADRTIAAAVDKFVSEIAWREFHADVLYHHPKAMRESLNPVQHDHSWATGGEAEAHFAAWCQGNTGFALVDAGMRELRATGTMHNRVRMVVASFLVKDLHVPWQRGADFFRRMLLDYDHAQNQLNWQWVAGTGRDAAPYFRIFNPASQAQKFDPDRRYIQRWIPDVDTPAYPAPIVDHARERDVTLAAYQAFRSGSSA